MEISNIIILIVCVIAAILGIYSGVRFELHRRRNKQKVTVKFGNKMLEIPDANSEDIKHFLECYDKIVSEKKKTADDSKRQEGYAAVEALLLIVPGIIALLFAGTFVYLLVKNQNTPNYAIPKELTAALTTIIGYYFGIDASNAIQKTKIVSSEQLRGMIGQDN